MTLSNDECYTEEKEIGDKEQLWGRREDQHCFRTV